MEGDGNKCKVLPKQTRRIMHKVYQYFEPKFQQADEAMHNTGNNLVRCQKSAASGGHNGIRIV
jgi:hypothetical protein